ncbi:MAG: hypothetical protein HY980_00800, partial [Candidatus Magasanikbacteria bacterium]|nr:hypothetical protein [Candidatus Magasanikbacteria bacterium]
KDGWDKDRTADCTSLIDFNEFEPVRWIDNEKIKINQYFDNYECAGKVTNVIVYNIKGEKLSEKNNLSGSLSN